MWWVHLPDLPSVCLSIPLSVLPSEPPSLPLPPHPLAPLPPLSLPLSRSLSLTHLLLRLFCSSSPPFSLFLSPSTPPPVHANPSSVHPLSASFLRLLETPCLLVSLTHFPAAPCEFFRYVGCCSSEEENIWVHLFLLIHSSSPSTVSQVGIPSYSMRRTRLCLR